MLYHRLVWWLSSRGASLSEQYTDLLICHSAKQDLSHTVGQLHKHELSFTLKSLAELLTFISAVYAWPLPEANHRWSWSKFVLPVGNLPSMICSKQGVSCQCTLTSVVSTPGNRRCTLAIASPTGDSECMSPILNFKRAHLKFTVYGRKQATKQASTHTHAQCM